MPTREDIRLGHLALAHSLILPREFDECLDLLRQEEKRGKGEALGEILVARGYLTRTQLERLAQAQREISGKATLIGPYELVRRIGEGGMGSVYLAKDTRSDKVVAMKVLARSKAKNTAFLERFTAEMRHAFELDHPHIVKALDLGEHEGYHYLVMEYVPGEDVFTLLSERGRLSEQEALNITAQIAEALEHIHEERLVHRDIKPENILVAPDGTAKLADMGLAIDREPTARHRLTKTGIAMGTPSYLSPEQAQGDQHLDIRSDIYSLGATLYEMVTGKPPFEGETPAIVMLKHLNEQVPSPHHVDNRLSGGLCHVIERMMAKRPDDRYQTPRELLADLHLVKKGLPPTSPRLAEGLSSVMRPHAEMRDRAHPLAEGTRSEDRAQGEPSTGKQKKPDPLPRRLRPGMTRFRPAVATGARAQVFGKNRHRYTWRIDLKLTALVAFVTAMVTTTIVLLVNYL